MIPAQLRQALGLVEWDELKLPPSAGGLLVRTRAVVLAELRSLGGGIPANRSLVDELIAGRRAAALAAVSAALAAGFRGIGTSPRSVVPGA